MISVYIIHSRKLDAYFAGSTRDLRRSLKKHRSGRSRHVKAAPDWFPVWQQDVASTFEARALEKEIKSKGLSEFLDAAKSAPPDKR